MNGHQKQGSNEKCIETIVEAVGALAADREKCIRQPVLTVEKNVKFPLNRMDQNLYTVGTAIRNTDRHGDFKSPFFLFFCSNLKS